MEQNASHNLVSHNLVSHNLVFHNLVSHNLVCHTVWFLTTWFPQPGFSQPGLPRPGFSQPGLPPQSGFSQPGLPQPGFSQPGLPPQSGFSQPGLPQPDFSQSGLPPLQPLRTTQNTSEFTNNTKLSPLKSAEQSFSSTPYHSQSQLPALPELPALPYEPFLAPELAKRNRQTPMAPQTFPIQQNTTMGGTHSQSTNSSALNAASVSRPNLTALNEQQSLASSQNANSQSTPLVRSEDFWKRPKPSTSQPLYFFMIFMVALIIGSTAILIIVTNSQHNGSNKAVGNQQQPATHANATATTAPQKSTPTAVATTNPQTEPNPYGNHDGILVVNNALNQQDPSMQWTESPGICSFSTDSYHVIASDQSQGFTTCNATASDYTNFVYQIQMTFSKVTPLTSSGGLVFRENKTDNQFYFFEIFTNGTYAFYRCPGTNGPACLLLSASKIGAIPAFHTDLNQPNTLAIVANANTLTLYVNNQLVVGPITDVAYSHGKIGLMARQNQPNAVTDVAFNSLKVWQL